MKSLEFVVDHDLRLTSVNGALAELCPAVMAHLGRSHYFDVLPRITLAGQDMVQQVVCSGEAVSLPWVDSPSFCGTTQAEVDIQPLAEESRVGGARVRVHRHTVCALAEKLVQSEHLIDIGKKASSLAHGVRNPLNAIKGAVVYLQRRYAHEDDLLEFADIMQEEISRLDRFITDFLSASLDGSDRVPTNLNELLQRVLRIVSLQAKNAGVVISFDSQPLPLLPLNYFQVEQAILNLLNNALAVLGPEGRIQVACSSVPDGSGVCVKISDTGPGLPESGQKSFSYPQNESAQNKGRGFGLFLTREVMQHHGGTLEIQSSANAGTVATLFFPSSLDAT